MEVLNTWFTILLLIVRTTCHVVQSNQQTMQVEERTGQLNILPLAEMKNLIKSVEDKTKIPKSETAEVIPQSKIDYSGQPEEVFENVLNALVKVVDTDMSRNLESFVEVWQILSQYFNGSIGEKRPITRLIEHGVKDLEIRTKDNEFDNVALYNVVYKAVHEDLIVTTQACDKYAELSKKAADYVKNDKAFEEAKRNELIELMHNCNSFLNDTATAFMEPEFAKVLWVPSAVTILARVALLAEASNRGEFLKMNPDEISSLSAELEKSIKRQFEFANKGTMKRADDFGGKPAGNLTDYEYDGCKLQAQMLYFDKKLYPYGVPEQFLITDDGSEINIADFDVSGNDPRHIKIYYNGLGHPHENPSDVVMNCFMGPSILSQVPGGLLTLSTTFVPQKTYLMRLLYLYREKRYGYSYPKDGMEYTYYSDLNTKFKNIYDRIVSLVVKDDNNLEIKIEAGYPNENNVERFKAPIVYHSMPCEDEKESGQTCGAVGQVFIGEYIVETVAAITVNAGNEVKQNIEIQAKDVFYIDLILGIELIILPTN